jgi:hypothetical protein
MSLEQALARARTRAPQILAAQGLVEEARGRLAGASVLLQENPTIEASVGPRHSANDNTTDYDIQSVSPSNLVDGAVHGLPGRRREWSAKLRKAGILPDVCYVTSAWPSHLFNVAI